MTVRNAAILALFGSWTAASVITAPHHSANSAGPFLAGAVLDGKVRSIIQRSCQDCHSDATRYPWYSYVAPASLLIARDVARGREHLNFSRWSEYPRLRRMRSLSEIANQVQEREMPLTIYTLIHHGAKLSDADIAAIFQWTQAERTRLIAQLQ
jgi:hypothetical protein